MVFLREMVDKHDYYPGTVSFVDKMMLNKLLNTIDECAHHYHLLNSKYDNPFRNRHCKNNGKNNRIKYTWRILALNLYYLTLLDQMLQSIQKQIPVHSFVLSCPATSFRMNHDVLHQLKQGYFLQKHLLQPSHLPFHHLISGY